MNSLHVLSKLLKKARLLSQSGLAVFKLFAEGIQIFVSIFVTNH